MTMAKGTSPKKERITKQEITEMMQLRRQGYSISAIAKSMGYHRQTISAHLKEKKEDLIAEEARKQVLSQALTSHFGQLQRFTQVDLKLMVDASKQEYQKKRREPRPLGPISTDGIMGLPYTGRPGYMTEEWARMYNPPPREGHLLASLREHTKESPVWSHWDRWRNSVSDYENVSRALWEWLEEKLEEEPPENIAPGELEATKDWLFGNILLVAGGRETVGPDSIKEATGDGKGVMVVAYASESPLSRYLTRVIEEVNKMPAWNSLVSATAELGNRESQSELRHIVRDMDRALVAIELMQALPGHCELCPA